VRHCIRVPADGSLLSKLIDATEPLATRDQDGDVIAAMNHFYKMHGLLHMPNCCQFQQDKEFSIEENDYRGLRKANESLDSLTDTYLIETATWEKMDDDVLDRQKEELEHKLLFFQLDPSKKKVQDKPDMDKEKRHTNSAMKKVEPPKKVLPKRMSQSNKMVQLDGDITIQVKNVKRKDSVSIPSITEQPTALKKNTEELKSFETESKKGLKPEPRTVSQKSATKLPTPVQRSQSKSAGVTRAGK
jgi:hypothetical protein